jgi:pimeloyl-ACP methyl ester carboxylesterase
MIVEVNGVRGVYEATGDGPPLVLLASPVARAKTYRTTADCLARTFRVITVELPGSGWAGAVGKGWSVGQYAEWAAGFIAALGLNRPVVIGHSHSGPIGITLAVRHANAIGRLVLVDATGTGPHPVVRVFAAGVLDLALEIGIVLTRWHHVLGNLLLHPRNFVRQVRDALTVDVRADAARVTVPTLVAWGRRDHTLPSRHAAEYARCLPDARVYLSWRGSHDWLIARPDEFASAVSAFALPEPGSDPIPGTATPPPAGFIGASGAPPAGSTPRSTSGPG